MDKIPFSAAAFRRDPELYLRPGAKPVAKNIRMNFSEVVEDIDRALSNMSGEDLARLYNEQFAKLGEVIEYGEDGVFTLKDTPIPLTEPQKASVRDLIAENPDDDGPALMFIKKTAGIDNIVTLCDILYRIKTEAEKPKPRFIDVTDLAAKAMGDPSDPDPRQPYDEAAEGGRR